MNICELINQQQFKRGFEQKKEFGPYILIAKHGPISYSPDKKLNKSEKLRIEARYGKLLVGWINFEVSDLGFGDKDKALVALDTVVSPEHRRKGIASAMYKFGEELGNTIKPSSMQTKAGKELWNNMHEDANSQPKFVVSAPNRVQQRTLAKVIELIKQGGEVPPQNISGVISRSPRIAWVEDNNAVVAVSVLKNPNPGYKEKVFNAAGVPELANHYIYESGYTYILPNHRGTGIFRKLLEVKMANVPQPIYATVRANNTPVLIILNRLGFKQLGEEYLSSRGTYNLVLYGN